MEYIKPIKITMPECAALKYSASALAPEKKEIQNIGQKTPMSAMPSPDFTWPSKYLSLSVISSLA